MHVPQASSPSGCDATATQFWDAVAMQFQPKSAAAMQGSDGGPAMQGQQWDATQNNSQVWDETQQHGDTWDAAAWDAQDSLEASWDEQWTEDEWRFWNSMTRRQKFRAQFGYEKPRGGQWQSYYSGKYGRSSKP